MNKTKSVFKVTMFAVIIFIAAAGGMYLGGKFGGNSKPFPEASADIFQNLLLQPGVEFPDAELLDRDFKPVNFQNLLNPNGTVILFMDHNCPPCHDLAKYWQKMVSEGKVEKKQIVGICFFNASQIEEIYLDYEIEFPVYADESYLFYDNFGVDAFPLTLVVDQNGIIRHSESDSSKRLGVSELKKLFLGK